MSKKLNQSPPPSAPQRSAPQRSADDEARRAYEGALIEEGLEDFRAGRYIEGAELDAWLKKFVSGEELPIPGDPSTRPKR